MIRRWLLLVVALVALGLHLSCGSCGSRGTRQVVVYTSLDQLYSEPIFRLFEKRTGVKVRPVYDTEAAKTAGLVNRILAERGNPLADVFWNNEIGTTILLKRQGALAPYQSPSTKSIPRKYKDRDGYWAGFAARARVLIANTDLVPPEQRPTSLFDLTNPRWKGMVSIGNPLFGTTATHVAALFLSLGADPAKKYFRALKDNGAIMVPGNAVSRDFVCQGETSVGFTDTDDAAIAIRQGRPVAMIFPDQRSFGTLLIPNTVALVKGAKHLEEARLLIDFLLSEEVEGLLANSPSAQIPLRKSVPPAPGTVPADSLRTMDVDFEQLGEVFDTSIKFVHELFIR